MRSSRLIVAGSAFFIGILAAGGALARPPVLTTPAAGDVRIVRDDFGVPHVYADTVYGLYFGYGRSVAEDRLFQLEMARRATQGLVSEVLGSSYVDFDVATRRLFLPASVRQQLARLAAGDRAVLEGYAAGVNAWIDEIDAHPAELLPKQFVDFGFQPTRWTAFDVAMIFVGTMSNRYGDFNTEIENSHILALLQARHDGPTAARIFDALLPRQDARAPTTLPPGDWHVTTRAMPATGVGAAAARAGSDRLESLTPRRHAGFSNCIVLGRSKSQGAASILINGPQFGWFVPSYVYSIGLHGAGFDVVGNTPFGYPVLLFGHNQRIAWGSTWGAGDVVDVYRERLKPDDPGRYWHDGAWRTFEQRTEIIHVRAAEPVEITVRRSVHGPVFSEDLQSGVAYARHRAWEGLELQTLFAWLRSTQALSYRQWIAHAADSAQSINWYYADVDGNAGYAYTGYFPERVAGHDNRLPVSGDGSFDWRGRRPFTTNPHSVDPRSGYVANWNNKPAEGALGPDVFWYSWSRADRIDYLHAIIDAQPRFTPDAAWNLIRSSSYADLSAAYFTPWFAAIAGRPGDGAVGEAARLLVRWDRQSRDDDADGYYDGPQTPIFQAFLAELVELVLHDDLDEAYQFFAPTGYPEPGHPTVAGLDIPPGVKTAIAALHGESGHDFLHGAAPVDVVARALGRAVARLQAAQGSDVTRWRLAVAPRPFSPDNFLGVPQADAGEGLVMAMEQNRGTENDMIVMNPGHIVGWEVTPPGQSGFISRSGTRSPHYADQFDMYRTFGRKRMWFYRAEVEANKRSEITLDSRRGRSDASR